MQSPQKIAEMSQYHAVDITDTLTKRMKSTKYGMISNLWLVQLQRQLQAILLFGLQLQILQYIIDRGLTQSYGQNLISRTLGCGYQRKVLLTSTTHHL